MSDDRFRLFLSNWLFSPLQGVLFGDWLRLLAANRFAVDPGFWPRALLTTASSLSNTLGARRERRLFAPRIAAAVVRRPLFILGHYRSGTTHLHNLLGRDPRFGFVNNYQANFPHTFLTTEAVGARLGSFFTMRKRPHDNVRLDLEVPTEDELALAAMTFLSPHLGWHFPRRADHYEERYLTFEAVTAAERRRWIEALRLLAAKLTVKTGRRLVFKSPLHTARIPLLLEAFPDALFVFLHREPTRVFQSTRHMEKKVEPLFRFQRRPARSRRRPDALDERILRRHRALHRAYLAERSRIAPGRLVEIAYDDLDRRPLVVLERLYRDLALPDFAAARPPVEDYLASIAGYRKNSYPPLEERIASRLRREWSSFYAAWPYPPP